jgi:hypothetical protein
MFSINIFTVLTITYEFWTPSGSLTRFRPKHVFAPIVVQWFGNAESAKSWEGHDFSRAIRPENRFRARTRPLPKSVIPSESRGTLRGAPTMRVPHPCFAFFAKKGGSRDHPKARFVGRARLQSCHKAQKKDSGNANPPARTTAPPAHFSSNRSAALSIIS